MILNIKCCEKCISNPICSRMETDQIFRCSILLNYMRNNPQFTTTDGEEYEVVDVEKGVGWVYDN